MLTKTNLPTINQKRIMPSKTKAKSLFVNVVLVLIFLTTNACAMNKEKSELYKRFSDKLSDDALKKILEELYPVESYSIHLVKDLEEIGFKCAVGKDHRIYCSKSSFLSSHWAVSITKNNDKITKLGVRKESSLP